MIIFPRLVRSIERRGELVVLHETCHPFVKRNKKKSIEKTRMAVIDRSIDDAGSPLRRRRRRLIRTCSCQQSADSIGPVLVACLQSSTCMTQ